MVNSHQRFQKKSVDRRDWQSPEDGFFNQFTWDIKIACDIQQLTNDAQRKATDKNKTGDSG